MTKPSLSLLFPWTSRARAALEGVGQANSGAGVGHYGIGGVADMLGVTRRKKRTIERSVRHIFLEGVVGRLPVRTP